MPTETEQTGSLLNQRLTDTINPGLRAAAQGGNIGAAQKMWGQARGVSQGIFGDYLAGRNGVTGQDAATAASNTGVMGGANETSIGAQRQMFIAKAFALEDEENKRFQNASTFLKDAYTQNTKPTVTSGLIDSMFSGIAESSAQTHSQNMDFIRQQIGGSGVRGGVAGDLAVQAEIARLGQVTGGLRDLGMYEMQQRAADSTRNLQAAFGLADFKNQSPSLLGMDALGTNLEYTDRAAGRKAMLDAANKAANASRDAGLMSLGGGVAGGILGLGRV